MEVREVPIFLGLAVVLASVTLASAPAMASPDPTTLLLLVDYVGVDYPTAVRSGQVVNEAEYEEMMEFAARIARGVEEMPGAAGKLVLQGQARALARRIADKAAASEIAGITRRLREGLLHSYPVASLPRRPPDLGRAELLYRQTCASCHGERGFGDGPSARNLDPAPIDFHNATRARERSLFGLYNTITLGVQGTSMASFESLSDYERWSLAFYVGSLFADARMVSVGEEAWHEEGGLTLREAVTVTPAELDATLRQGAAMAAFARRRPRALFDESSHPIATAISRVEASAAAYGAGDHDRAESLAVSAYLEGFEFAEAGLGAVAPGLERSTEESMIRLRNTIGREAPTAEVEERSAETVRLLRRSQVALQEEPLTPSLAFTGSLLILLREGLEAILILGAIAAFLVKTGRRDAMVFLHVGWIGALVVGLATWAAAAWVIDVSGAAREVTEGVTALLAAGVLFYVGFWMHHKLKAKRWNRFLQERVQRALDGRTTFGLTFISFVAVYREVFETVLFYQALWSQAESGSRGALVAGAIVALVALVVLSWGVLKLGVRLPLRQFFALSGGLLFALAVVFAGKGVAALQEAGKISVSPVGLPRVELLGIYPSLQGLTVQLLLVSAAMTLVWWSRREEAKAS